MPTESRTVAVDPSPRFEERVKVLATWAGIAYALGFVCILVHTARYGIQVIEVIKPLNFWVGFPLTALILISGYVWEKYLGPLAEKAEEKRRALIEKSSLIPRLPTLPSFGESRARTSATTSEKKKQGLTAELLNLLVVVATIAAVYFGLSGTLPAGTWVAGSIRAVLLVIAVSAGLPLSVQLTAIFRHWFEKYKWLRLGFLSLVTIAVSLYYIVRVYPFVPHSVGGGWPAEVRLILDAEAYKDSPLARDGLLTSQGSTSTTGNVCLLYKTGDEYIVDFKCSLLEPQQSRMVVSIPEKSIRAILWQARPAYRSKKPPWDLN